MIPVIEVDIKALVMVYKVKKRSLLFNDARNTFFI